MRGANVSLLPLRVRDREEGRNRAFLTQWEFETNFNDHFETPASAYADVMPLLQCVARQAQRHSCHPGIPSRLDICSGRLPTKPSVPQTEENGNKDRAWRGSKRKRGYDTTLRGVAGRRCSVESATGFTGGASGGSTEEGLCPLSARGEVAFRQMRIYDPYFCQGKMRDALVSLGVPSAGALP